MINGFIVIVIMHISRKRGEHTNKGFKCVHVHVCICVCVCVQQPAEAAGVLNSLKLNL